MWSESEGFAVEPTHRPFLYSWLFRNFEKGLAYEPVPKTNTCYLALSVPHRMDPKYRYRVLQGAVRQEVYNCLQVFPGQNGCEAVELNVQPDHIHLVVYVPPKMSVPKLMDITKGRSAIRIFKQFPFLKKKPYWGNHLWAKGYCVDTVGLDDMIRSYVKYKEKKNVIRNRWSLITHKEPVL